MKTLLGGAAGLLLAAGLAAAQDPARLHTRPLPPSVAALDRLHLKMAWRAYLPTDGARDGLFSVQLFGNQVLVQTRSGTIVALGADDGITQWTARVGTPYRLTHALSANSKSIFAVRGLTLYDFDRQTGQVRWSFELPGSLAAAPGADEDRIYLCLGTGHLSIYELPEARALEEAKLAAVAAGIKTETKDEELKRRREAYSSFGVRGTATGAVGALASARDARQARQTGPAPELLFDYRSHTRLEQEPLLTDDQVVVAGSDGTYVILSKVQNVVPHEFKAGGELSAPLGQHQAFNEEGHPVEIVYVPSRDYNLYAVNTWHGRREWRFTAGSALLHKPAVTDEDVYVRAEKAGLYRLDRRTGELRWHNPNAQRFLAMNKKYVYATDRVGRLLVLDRAYGSRRAALDTSAFVVPISNEWTDRVFLASNDGLLVCLHDRAYPTPLKTKTTPERKAPPKEKAEDKKDEAKDADKAEDKPKDEAPKKPAAKPAPKPAPKPPAKGQPQPKADDKQP